MTDPNAGPSPTRGQTTREDFGAMPPPDSPLLDSYHALRNSALAGNAAAGCRLGTELARCASYQEQSAALDERIAQASALSAGSAEEALQLQALARERSGMARSEQVCRGITAEQSREAWRLVYRAARAGHLPSILAFAIRPPLSESNFTADLEGWRVYRQEAVPMLQEAVRRGSPRAAYHLAWVYGHLPVAGGAPLAPRDAIAATGFALLARPQADARSAQQIDRMIGRWRSEIGPAGWAQAVRWASQHALPASDAAQDGLDFVNGAVPQPEDCGR